MNHTVEIIKNEIKRLENRILDLQKEHESCAYAGREVEIQILISSLSSELRTIKKLLELVERK